MRNENPPPVFLSSGASSDQLAVTKSPTMKGTVYIATTVDNKIATPDGGIDFLNDLPPPTEDDTKNEYLSFAQLLASVDCMVMGRKTFDKVVSFGKDMWVYGKLKIIVQSRDPAKVSIPDHLTETVSTSGEPPNALFERLESEGFKNVYIDGGCTIQRFLEAGLVTDMHLTRVPVLLGDGIDLFGSGGKQNTPIKLKATKTFAYSNGMVMTSYEIIKN